MARREPQENREPRTAQRSRPMCEDRFCKTKSTLQRFTERVIPIAFHPSKNRHQSVMASISSRSWSVTRNTFHKFIPMLLQKVLRDSPSCTAIEPGLGLFHHHALLLGTPSFSSRQLRSHRKACRLFSGVENDLRGLAECTLDDFPGAVSCRRFANARRLSAWQC